MAAIAQTGRIHHTYGRRAVADPVDGDRVATLVCRVLAGAAVSHRRASRICRRLQVEGLLPAGTFTRTSRRKLITALHTALSPRVDAQLLRSSLADAVLLDELAALPELQRLVVQAVHEHQLDLDDAATRLGIGSAAAAGLLREALLTLSAHTSLSPG